MTLRLTITWEFQSHDIYIQTNLDNNANDVYLFGTIGKKWELRTSWYWRNWHGICMSHHQWWWFIIVVLSGVPTVNPLCPRSFLLSPVLPTHPLVLKHSFLWYWNIFPVVLKEFKLVDGFQIPIVHFSTVHFRPWYACSKARWAGLKRIISILLIYTGFLKVSMILNNCQEYLQSLDQAKSARKREKYANLFELSSDLSNGKFVKNISIYPSLQVTLVHPDMTREFENICKILYSERCPGEIPFKRRKKKK